MKDDDFRRLVEDQINRSDWWENSELVQNHTNALDSYFGRKRPAAIPGRSNARSMDVADMVEAMTAEIMPGFDYDDVAMFDAEGPDDVEQARLESRICASYLKLNRGRIALQEAIRNALSLRAGPIKVHVDTQSNTDQERYLGLDAIELDTVQRPTHPNQTVRVNSVRLNEDNRDLVDVTITRTTHYRKLEIVAVDPTNMIVPRNWTSQSLNGAEICGERFFAPRYRLPDYGFTKKQMEEIQPASQDTRTSTTARNRDAEQYVRDRVDKSLQQIEIFELYMMVDYDGDGYPELRRVFYAGRGHTSGQMGGNEPWPFQPYATAVPIIVPHRYWGMSAYDKLIEVEQIKTNALRQQIDNLEQANFAELEVEDGNVSEGDLEERAPGGVIRSERIGSVAPIPVVDTGSSSRAFLTYIDSMRSERFGAALDLQKAEFQVAANNGAVSTERQMQPKERLSRLIGHTIGETLLPDLFQKIHDTLRNFMPQTAEFAVARNQFVSATPAEWRPRQLVTVLAGLSVAERNEKRLALSEVVAQQEKLWTAGFDNVLVNFDTYHSALLDWTKAGGTTTPRRYWLDPAEPQQQQAWQQKQVAAQQAAEEQKQLQERLFSTQVLISDRDNMADLTKHMTQLRFDYWKERTESEVAKLSILQKAMADDGSRLPPTEKLEGAQAEGEQRENVNGRIFN